MATPPRSDLPVVGVDLGATNMNLALVDPRGTIIARAHRRTEGEHGLEHVLDRIIDAVRHVAEEGRMAPDQLGGVGVAVASPVDAARGIALHAVNLGWKDVPLRELLQGRLELPVAIDNDVNGAVWGEHVAGAARGRGDVLGVWVGTGVGGGLVLDGRLHHGTRHTAGEFGHTVIIPDAAPGLRTIEDLCSRTGLSRVIHRRITEFPDSMLNADVNAGDIVPSDRLAQAWEAGDPLAREVVEQAARLLGIGLANCVTLLSLDIVVVGGGVTEALGPPFLASIRHAFNDCVFPEQCRACEIVMTALAADAGMLGAAMLVRPGSREDG